MRINQFIAQQTGLGRRAVDQLIKDGQVTVSDQPAVIGQSITERDEVKLQGQTINPVNQLVLLQLNKPAGYVCSRDGQGSLTIYDLLPKAHHNLKPIGRLDKDSSGLLLLTNDGQLANQLAHPSQQKDKIYLVELNRPLASTDRQQLERGVELDDGPSRLQLSRITDTKWQVTLHEGRNRQIRRSFASLDYQVKALQRIQIGPYNLGTLQVGKFIVLPYNKPLL